MDIATTQSTPIMLYFIYAPQDEALLKQLEQHLSLLRRQAWISDWQPYKILPGTEWMKTLNQHLQSAGIILLLISPDFMASNESYDIEMQQALERSATGKALVVPILLRPTDWESAPFAHLQYLPRSKKFITSFSNRDAAFATIATELRALIKEYTTGTVALPFVQAEKTASAPTTQQQNDPHIPFFTQMKTPAGVQRDSIRKVLRKAYTEELHLSLRGVARIALGLHDRLDLTHTARLASSWQSGQTERVYPDGTTIVDAYDQSGHGLLILGEPGSGKSTLLYDLAQTLLARTDNDSMHALPIILNLSSWALQLLPLGEWIVKELELRYVIPRKIGARLVQDDQLILLLDGLDEVGPAHRNACIAAINQYHQEHLHQLVVCSRREEYEKASQFLSFQSAIIIQPLSSSQVKEYFARTSASLEVVQAAVERNPVLQEVLSTPLMLSVVTLTYQGDSVEKLPEQGSADNQQQQIFNSYLQHMLYQSGKKWTTSTPKMQRYLTWLAQQMQYRNQSVFYLERLQPYWLSTDNDISWYTWLGVRLPAFVIGMLVHIIVYLSFIPEPPDSNLFYGLGVFGGILGCFLCWLRMPSPLNIASVSENSQQRMISAWKDGLLIGGLFSVFIFFVPLLEEPDVGLIRSILDGLSAGLMIFVFEGLAIALISLILRQSTVIIEPTEILMWSWKDFWQSLTYRKHFKYGLLIVLGNILFPLLVTSEDIFIEGFNTWLLNGFSNGLSLGLVSGVSLAVGYWLLVSLIRGSSNASFQEKQRIVPNQGIHRSIRNGLSLGFCCGIIGIVVSGFAAFLEVVTSEALGHALSWSILYPNTSHFSYGLNDGLSDGMKVGPDTGLQVGLAIGLATGLIVFLLIGGLAWWRHYIVRFLLWRNNALPWHTVKILDEAAQHVLLRKLGGGYCFIHDLFRDYMASLADDISTTDDDPFSPNDREDEQASVPT